MLLCGTSYPDDEECNGEKTLLVGVCVRVYLFMTISGTFTNLLKINGSYGDQTPQNPLYRVFG